MSDVTIAALYATLKARRDAQPTAVRDLPVEDRRAYQREAARASRARRRDERDGGTLKPTAAAVDAVLRDAALMLLATGGPGASEIKSALAVAFGMPGLPLNVEAKARSGEMRPRILTAARLRGGARA